MTDTNPQKTNKVEKPVLFSVFLYLKDSKAYTWGHNSTSSDLTDPVGTYVPNPSIKGAVTISAGPYTLISRWAPALEDINKGKEGILPCFAINPNYSH